MLVNGLPVGTRTPQEAQAGNIALGLHLLTQVNTPSPPSSMVPSAIISYGE